MRPTGFRRHPPARLAHPGTTPAAGEVVAHAALSVAVEVTGWDERRDGHLHLVAALEHAVSASAWRAVDLSRHPMAPAPAVKQPDWEAIESGLREWVEAAGVRLLRSPDVGLVSEIWEPRSRFEQRVRQLLAPALRGEIERDRDRPLPRLPWRRRAEQRRRAERREALAAELASVVARIEEYEVGDPWTALRGVEVGLLEVPAGVVLAGPQDRDPMVAGSPRVARPRA